MAEATATRPRARATKASGTAAQRTAKPAEAQEAPDTTTKRVTLELEPLEPTKSFAKFGMPEGSGCVGTFYAPLGTESVKVLLISPAE